MAGTDSTQPLPGAKFTRLPHGVPLDCITAGPHVYVRQLCRLNLLRYLPAGDVSFRGWWNEDESVTSQAILAAGMSPLVVEVQQLCFLVRPTREV